MSARHDQPQELLLHTHTHKTTSTHTRALVPTRHTSKRRHYFASFARQDSRFCILKHSVILYQHDISPSIFCLEQHKSQLFSAQESEPQHVASFPRSLWAGAAAPGAPGSGGRTHPLTACTVWLDSHGFVLMPTGLVFWELQRYFVESGTSIAI